MTKEEYIKQLDILLDKRQEILMELVKEFRRQTEELGVDYDCVDDLKIIKYIEIEVGYGHGRNGEMLEFTVGYDSFHNPKLVMFSVNDLIEVENKIDKLEELYE